MGPDSEEQHCYEPWRDRWTSSFPGVGMAHGCPPRTVRVARKRTDLQPFVIDPTTIAANIGDLVSSHQTAFNRCLRGPGFDAVGSFSLIPIFDATPG